MIPLLPVPNPAPCPSLDILIEECRKRGYKLSITKAGIRIKTGRNDLSKIEILSENLTPQKRESMYHRAVELVRVYPAPAPVMTIPKAP
jgi:hypothetical protein